MTKSHLNYLTYRTKSRWPTIDTQFVMGISAIGNHCICHSILFMALWQPFYHLHILSPLVLLYSSLIPDVYIYPLKCIFKCLLIVDNNTLQNSVSLYQFLSPLAGLLNWLLLFAKWILALLPHSR
jgi:hypothetical protein